MVETVLIAQFAAFDNEHPGFKIFSTIGEVTVISLQSPLMRKQLLKDKALGENNGMVNDAAHGWWKDRNALLIITSTYCPELFCWVPGVFSYSNGASAEHYKYHFRAVFKSISQEAKERSIPISDSLFAGVCFLCSNVNQINSPNFFQMMDFSDAERSGFIQAFIEFWSITPGNQRSEEELRVAGHRLLKGCQEHFRAGITRVSRISAAVPPEMAPFFVARARALLNAPNSEEFVSRAQLIISEYPKLKAWMDWWTRPEHAAMLFESERTMDVKLWESMPATNNAEEAMHWKLYSCCGRNHELLDGLMGLYAVAEYYQLMDVAARSEYDLLQCLTTQREKFRGELRKRKLIRGTGTYESLWVGVPEILSISPSLLTIILHRFTYQSLFA